MRVSIDTETDTFEAALATLYSAYGMGGEEDDDAEDDEPGSTAAPVNGSTVLPGGWNAKRLRKWTTYLQPDAAEIVRYVAANAPEVSYDDAAAHLSEVNGETIIGKQLGGRMSSGGHALKHVGQAVKSQPIDRDHSRRMYVVDERVAAILAEELGPPEVV